MSEEDKKKSDEELSEEESSEVEEEESSSAAAEEEESAEEEAEEAEAKEESSEEEAEEESAEEEAEEEASDEEAEVEEEPEEPKEKPKAKAKPKTPKAASEKKKTSTKKTKKAEPKVEEEPRSKTEVFATGGGPLAQSGYLGADDLDDMNMPKSKGPIVAVLVGTLLLVGAGAFVITSTAIGEDIKDVFAGEYRAKKEAERKRKEEAFKKEQEEKLPKYGTLMIEGQPKYATIKLNGQLLYGQTSAGFWREVQLIPGFSVISNLDIKQKQTVEVSAPGFTPKTVELTQGMWKGGASGGTYGFPLTASLIPVTPEAQAEMDARMGADVETDFFGKIALTSNPPGASVKINNAPLLNEKGEELKTPVTFEKYWVKNAKEGDKNFGKLEERPVRVDTILDQGHKIEVTLPAQPNQPKFIMQLERQMWTCDPLDEKALKKLPKEHSPQLECNYVFKKNVDFNSIAAFIKKREEEKAKVEKLNEEMKKAKEAFEKGQNKMDDKTKELLEK